MAEIAEPRWGDEITTRPLTDSDRRAIEWLKANDVELINTRRPGGDQRERIR